MLVTAAELLPSWLNNLALPQQVTIQGPKALLDDLGMAVFQSRSSQILTRVIEKSPVKIMVHLISRVELLTNPMGSYGTHPI